MLSVPLVWHDAVVGVLNVQTRDAPPIRRGRDRVPGHDRRPLAGIVEKGRLTAEVEAVSSSSRPSTRPGPSSSRWSRTSCGRHSLSCACTWTCWPGMRRVRSPRHDTGSRRARNGGPGRDQLARLDRLVDSILASVRGEGLTNLSRAPFDVVAAVDETVETCDSCSAPARSDGSDRASRTSRSASDAIPPGPRAAARKRVQVRRDGGRGRSASGESAARSRSTSRTTAGASPARTGRASSSRSSGRGPGASRGSGIGLFAARRLMDAMGGRIFLEMNGTRSTIVGRCPPRAERALRCRAARYTSSAPVQRPCSGTDADRADAPVSDEPQTAAAIAASPGKRDRYPRDRPGAGWPACSSGRWSSGLGGRLAMRLATIAQEGAVGGVTDNGNRKSRASPWARDTDPGNGRVLVHRRDAPQRSLGDRDAVAASRWGPASRRGRPARDRHRHRQRPDRRQPTGDFIQLRHDPAIVAMLIALVGLVGPWGCRCGRWLARASVAAPADPRAARAA